MRLIDELPGAIRLPLRGLITVTMFGTAAAFVAAVLFGIYWLCAAFYSWVGPDFFIWGAAAILLYVVLAWIGAESE